MKVTSNVKVPNVDVAQAQKILKAAFGYEQLKKKIEVTITEALKSKDLGVKNQLLRELRMML